MALKSVYTASDDIPAEHRALYEEQGDVFVLSIEDIDSPPKVRGVITANRENAKKRDEYKAKVTEVEGKIAGLPEDFDADEWAQLKAGNGGKPDEALQALKDQHTKAVQTLKDKHATDLAERDGQIGERDGYIDRTPVDGGLKDALLDVGVNPELLDGAMANRSNYAFRMMMNDTPATGTAPAPSERLFVGLVMSAQEAGGDANTIRSLNATIEINTNIVTVPATAGAYPRATLPRARPDSGSRCSRWRWYLLFLAMVRRYSNARPMAKNVIEATNMDATSCDPTSMAPFLHTDARLAMARAGSEDVASWF